ncbi:outer membrane beta-barrel family protein [Portibacter lacus]|uniref:TonB-dependent receptor n=1 Tax=Portibacter lacus TaxID=1099794 RepID=A0AA37SPD7_9BACT|nr:outer membrane beta-barrel family protein [Portibacter lacus]GLR18443.1 TonB-dependent receptor [Portibacter lacus]
MENRLAILLVFLCTLTLGYGQKNNKSAIQHTISGKIIDGDSGVPLEFSTLSLFETETSTLVGGAITDQEGKYTIETKPGNYYLEIEFISYAPGKITDIVVTKDNKNIELPDFNLSIDAEKLDEVVIVEERSQVSLSLDKKVFNVGKDLTNKGGTAEDVLDNVPSVSVDLDGGVELRGSGGVRILIDGKPSMMVGDGNTNGLRNIPSNMIESVEVITNPSSRYEAEGMAGIINIVLKKDRKRGFNGSIDVSGGYPLMGSTAFNLNYRREKINLFSSIGAGYRTGPGSGFTYQEQKYFDGTSEIFSSTRDMNRNGVNGNISLGMDYFINDNNILTSSFSFRRSLEENRNSVFYEDFLNSREQLVGLSERYDDELENEYDTEYALTYDKKLKGKDHSLIADLRFQDNTEIESSDFSQEFFDANRVPTGEDNLIQRSANSETERRINLKLDYKRPLPNDGVFETGIQSSYRLISNKYLVEEEFDNEWIRLANLSNDFNYNEFINGVYGIYGKEYLRWSYQVGVRAEYSLIETELLDSDEGANSRDYINLFPSAFVSYKINDENSFQVSYSRRIRRPRFRDLNPFFTFSDPRNQYSGNPNLNPEFTDSYEIGYVNYFEKGSLTSSFYYRHSTDVMDWVQTVTSDGVTIRRPENLNTQDDLGFEFTGNYKFVKWYDLSGSLNIFRSITDGANVQEDFTADAYSWFTRLNNKIKMSKTFEAQVRVDHRGARKTTQGSRKGITSIDIGLGKEFPKQNISLSVNVRDLLNSRKYQSINEFALYDDNAQIGTFYSESEFQRRARSVVVSLNYRINQEKKRGREKGNGGDFDGGGEEF